MLEEFCLGVVVLTAHTHWDQGIHRRMHIYIHYHNIQSTKCFTSTAIYYD